MTVAQQLITTLPGPDNTCRIEALARTIGSGNEPVLHWAIRLQRRESGTYFTASSLHISDIRSFIDMREIVKICPRSRRA
jgi:hypothetical protein